MRIAVSGSHSTGKSSLIAQFLRRFPDYAHEPEAFETLGDDVDLTESGAPTPDGLRSLLEYTVAAVQNQSATDVVFERSPADYLAYAAASRGAWLAADIREFVAAHAAVVQSSLRQLDLIAYLPLSASGVAGRHGEDEPFRRKVDLWMRRVLLEDEYELFTDSPPPQLVALPATPDRQLAALERWIHGRS